MMLRIESLCLKAIKEDAASNYPDEGCGLLLGSDGPEKEIGRMVKEFFPTPNRWEDEEKRRRFSITASDFLAAEIKAQERGLEIIGIYHSHPDHKPIPSDYDLEKAWPFYSYLIVEVVKGQIGSMASWRLLGDRTKFTFEDLLVEPKP
ncbi:MAG: M67 family metallopeptidase [Deltaproteobacteria bacterium]|jgi:proteasome lid subunit RPN8/RPN11|nr:M67 family metallopeptidase [Deltaproteobacteria bacterium]